MKYQKDYPHLTPSMELVRDLKVGELITNIFSGAVWPASEWDVETIKPDEFETHARLFRKMIPVL